MSRNYPSEQRINLVGQFHSILQRRQEEDDLTFDRAFSQLALEVLGYDLDAGTMSDGRGDFGVDFWIVEERAATLFQFKSHDFTERLNRPISRAKISNRSAKNRCATCRSQQRAHRGECEDQGVDQRPEVDC